MTIAETIFTMSNDVTVGKIALREAAYISVSGLPSGTGAGPTRNDMIEVKQSTAVEVRVYMKGTDTERGLSGGSSTMVVNLCKTGESSHSVIAPAITDLGYGWYALALTTTHTNTLGIATFHITMTGAFSNDELTLNVIAINKQDAVRMGLTALPNATAGANTGLPVVGTQVPNATAGANAGLPVVGTQIPLAAAGVSTGLPVLDANLNSAADLQRWIGTAPSALSSGLVQATTQAINGTSTTAISTALLDASLTGHATAGTVGGALTTAAAFSTAAVATAVLDALLTDHAVEGSVADGVALAASLLQGNYVVDQTDTSDPNGQTSARLRCFRTGVAAAAATDGGVGEGEFATFVATTEYSGVNKILTHRVARQ